MRIDDFDFTGGDNVPVRISAHARDQWRDRMPGYLLSTYPLDESTWEHADVVIAPEADCDEARLVVVPEARDMLLCGKHEPDRTVVATVLYADHGRLRRP